MSERRKGIVAHLLVVAACVALFLPGIGWGLPSREADRYLFGDRRPWTGAAILKLLEEPPSGGQQLPLPLAGVGGGEGSTSRPSARSDPHPNPLPQAGEGTGLRGADVDANPIVDRSGPVVLNATDRQRAEIVQRYRLMSGQPDEFIQFKALAEMAGRTGLAKLDPRLYQYGGLWIYPVGALVRTSMLLGIIESPPAGVSAREWYLDHPEAFGKFYVVARLYSAAWGVVAALALTWIARRVTRSHVLGVLPAVGFILLPVTRTAAHEAKPHLAGAALCLLAVIAATRYVDTGRSRWGVVAGGLCGAAMGMVISMLLSLAVLPMMVWLRRRRLPLPLAGEGGGEGSGSRQDARSDLASCPDARSDPHPNPLPQAGEGTGSFVRPLLAAVACAFAVYALTNPFVLYNAIAHPEILRSNLGNSTAMYGVGNLLDALRNASRILSIGMTSWGFFVIAAALVSRLLLRMPGLKEAHRDAHANKERSVAAMLLAAPACVIALQFIALSAGKPAEYARFGIVFIAACCVASVVMAATLRRVPRRAAIALVVAALLVAIVPQRNTRRIDRAGWPTPKETADRMDQMRRRAAAEHVWSVGLMYEPAPWSAPPLNLFEQQLVLVRPDVEAFESLDAIVWPLNLQSQLLGGITERESVDWRDNRFGVRSEPRDGGPDRYRNWH